MDSFRHAGTARVVSLALVSIVGCAPARSGAVSPIATAATVATVPPPLPPGSSVAPAATDAAPDFSITVAPILSARCAPCHVPGGRMYERLPFDDGDTVAENRAGVLRRLKGDDRAAVESWLAQRR